MIRPRILTAAPLMHVIKVFFLFLVVLSGNLLVIFAADVLFTAGAFSIAICSDVFEPNQCVDWVFIVKLWADFILFNLSQFL